MDRESPIARTVSRCVGFCQNRAIWVTMAAFAVTVVAAGYFAINVRIDTDTQDMLSAELPFREHAVAVDRLFPNLDDNILIVIEAPNADAATDAVQAMATALGRREDLFSDVFAPDADPFLLRHGFLYMDLDALEDLTYRLAAAQPFLGTLWRNPNVSGLADMAELLAAGDATDAATLEEAARVLAEMADVVETARAGGDGVIVWSKLILDTDTAARGPERGLISAKPVLDYGSLQPAARAKDEISEIADDLDLADKGVGVRLTGSAALESDELRSVEEGMGIAGLVSLVLVTLVLWFGLRSLGAMAALLMTLIFGLVWTAALAILTVGALNLISVAFAVLFVGLSVDFGIHFTLRAREGLSADGSGWDRALVESGRRVGPTLAVCALTTSIAFFSFLPTDYDGLAELGLIAGLGMGVALIANLTVLPALLRLLDRTPRPAAIAKGEAPDVSHGPPPAATVLVLALVTLAAAWFAQEARFDFDPMNLRDSDAPSMRALLDLAEAGKVEPYAAEVLVADRGRAEDLIARLEALPEVAAARGPDVFIPDLQSEKLTLIDDMALFLGPAFFQPRGEVDVGAEALTRAAVRLRQNLITLEAVPFVGAEAGRLARALADIDADQLAIINRALFGGLPGRLDTLVRALEPGPIDMKSLPERLKRRHVAADGTIRVDIEPAQDLRDPVQLRKFVDAVRAVAPSATGSPIIIAEAGRAVLRAFGQALLMSLIGIGLVLWLVLRRPLDVALVLTPVAVAAIWTLAASQVLGVPFNFANVIVLPLLFGLSVDFGIHMVMRSREVRARGSVSRTSTPRAVLLSALTTIGSFGAIMLSGHPGTASMGTMLTVSLILSLIATLVLLPALLTLAHRPRAGG